VGSAGKTSRRSNQGLEDRARTYTNSYQPRGPVPEALRGHGDARQILLLSESNREGKGLSRISSSHIPRCENWSLHFSHVRTGTDARESVR
jgi:hypothetical protein